MAATNLFDAIFQPERSSRVAVLYEEREITYEELRDLTVQAAETLRALAIDRGDRVGILLNDSPEFVASFVAIISLGAIAVPVNMALSKEEQRLIVKDCGAIAAVVEGKVVNELFRDGGQSANLESLIIVRGDLPGIDGIATTDMQSAWSELGDFPVTIRQGEAAFILYTSGSTGEPKGAVHSQSDIFYTNETFCQEVLRLREGDRLFSSSRLPF
ncbi:MAG TPA: AMP-binding protein, partial [Pyrinomonadaceae bacterium]